MSAARAMIPSSSVAIVFVGVVIPRVDVEVLGVIILVLAVAAIGVVVVSGVEDFPPLLHPEITSTNASKVVIRTVIRFIILLLLEASTILTPSRPQVEWCEIYAFTLECSNGRCNQSISNNTRLLLASQLRTSGCLPFHAYIPSN